MDEMNDCATPKAWLGCMTAAVIVAYVVTAILLMITFGGG